jgi:hypothetical protein
MNLIAKDRCRACDTPIAFAITAKFKRMPLDVVPVEQAADLRGLQVVEHVERQLRCRQATPADVAAGADLFRSHFATCPDGPRFRR